MPLFWCLSLFVLVFALIMIYMIYNFSLMKKIELLSGFKSKNLFNWMW